MKTFIRFIVGFYFFAALACIRAENSEDRKNVTMTVNHYKVPCVGSGAQLCYLTREVDQPSWEYLFEGVSGFDYEWGKVYELEVEKTRRKNVKADQSPVQYKLVRIVSVKDAPAGETFSMIVKDSELVAVRSAGNGEFTLMGQYPVRCNSASLCEELGSKLETQMNITGLFRHSDDHQSLVLQSIKN